MRERDLNAMTVSPAAMTNMVNFVNRRRLPLWWTTVGLWLLLMFVGCVAFMSTLFVKQTAMLTSIEEFDWDWQLWVILGFGAALGGYVAFGLNQSWMTSICKAVAFTIGNVGILLFLAVTAERFAEFVVFWHNTVTTMQIFRILDGTIGRKGGKYAVLDWRGLPIVELKISNDLFDNILARRYDRRTHEVLNRHPVIRTHKTTDICLKLPVEAIGSQARIPERDQSYLRPSAIINCPSDTQILYLWPPRL